MKPVIFIGGDEDLVGGSERWTCSECGRAAYIADPALNKAIQRALGQARLLTRDRPLADTSPTDSHWTSPIVVCGRRECVLRVVGMR